MKLRHWFIFILLNVVISGITTLALLVYWERTHSPRAATPVAEIASPTSGPSPTLEPVASPIPPQPTRTPTPFPHTIYTVQSGDTLNAISRRFNVPVGDLLIANGLSIEAVLHVGQEIKIPMAGGQQPGATAAPSPSPTLPSSELAPVAETSVEIRQVIARGDPSREAIVIANLGRPVNLLGWKLSDNAGTMYTFPDLTLWPGGTISVHTGSGPDSVGDLYWKRTLPVWAEPGDVATLSDANGQVAARYQLP